MSVNNLNSKLITKLNTELTDTVNTGVIEDLKTERDMGEIYSLVLEAYMPVDVGLNGGMEFIAIDMSNLEELDETDKEQIVSSFKDYEVDVIEATFEQLKEMGLYDAHKMALKGVLLSVENIEISDRSIKVEGSKYRSAKGAIGLNVVVELINGKWLVTKVEETWIS